MPTSIDDFLQTLGSDNTRRAYRRDLTTFFQRTEDENSEDWTDASESVTPSDVNAWVREMAKDGLATSTQRRRISAMKRWFDWLVDTGRHDRNPVRTGRVRPKEPSDASTSEISLTKSDVERLIRVAGKHEASGVRDRALILTIVYASLRRAEVAAMDVEHVRPLGRHWVIDIPDGDDRKAVYVKVPEVVARAVDSVCDAYAIDKGALWRSVSNRNAGTRMTPGAIYKVVRDVGDRAGLEGVTIDALRNVGLRLASKGGATLSQTQSHGRLQTPAAAARYASSDDGGRLTNSAVDFVELDLEATMFELEEEPEDSNDAPPRDDSVE